MTNVPKTRPKFSNPPVIEVAATIQFSDLGGNALLLSLSEFWKILGEGNYPVVELKQPRMKLSDQAGSVQFALINENDGYAAPRVWFLSEDQTRLVQLQSDRLVFNWRQLDRSNPSYSSYEIVWKNFQQAMQALTQFSAKYLDKKIEADFVELLYINLIPFSDFGGAANIEACIPSMSFSKMPKAYLAEPNAVNFMWDIPIEEARSTLRIQGLTGPDVVTGEPMLRMDLLQRGAISAVFDKDETKIHNWFDDAHYRIVNTFKSMTGSEMHKQWGLQE